MTLDSILSEQFINYTTQPPVVTDDQKTQNLQLKVGKNLQIFREST